jgi:hypothetical protein
VTWCRSARAPAQEVHQHAIGQNDALNIRPFGRIGQINGMFDQMNDLA